MDSQVITCPNCGRVIFHYDRKATNTFEVKCRHCDQMVCINTFEGIVKSVKPIKKIQIKSSYGRRFY